MPGGRRRIDHVLDPDVLERTSTTSLCADVRDVDTRLSKKRPTSRTSVGCCRVASTSCAPSSDAVPATSADRWSTSSPASSPMAPSVHRTAPGTTTWSNHRASPSNRRSVEQLVSDVGVSDVVNRSDDELAESLTRSDRLRGCCVA